MRVTRNFSYEKFEPCSSLAGGTLAVQYTASGPTPATRLLLRSNQTSLSLCLGALSQPILLVHKHMNDSPAG